VPVDLPAGEVVVAGQKIGPAGIAEFSRWIEPTMSVNRTVERMRSRLSLCRSPVKNASISSTTAPTSATYGG
jgi:hypothetical protein